MTVSALALTDILAGIQLGALDKTTLAPGETATATATYVVKQSDVDAGEINNTVTATGKDPKDAPVTGEDSEKVTTEEAAASIKVTKTADKTSGVKVNETITYTIKVENTGNVSVKAGKLVDDHADLSDKTFALAPGKTAEFTYTYTATQADIDAGSIVNVVKANGTAVRGDDPAEVSATATVTAEDAAAKLSITKTADPTKDVAVGDTITYTVVVTNTGNVSVKDGKLADDHADLSDKTFALAPGEKATFTYTYTVTQDDVDAGSVVNVVTANATAVRGDDPEEAEATATVTAEDAAAKLSIKKTADLTTVYEAGETITYTVVVKNEGNVSVKTGKLADDHADLSKETFELAPNGSATFTYTYTVTQADMDAGKIVNTVKANAKAVRGNDPAEVNANATVDVEMDGHLTITKETTSTPANGKTYALGEEITYKITVLNDGNLTITNITVTDELTGDEWTIKSLTPNKSEAFETSYTVTEADVLAGQVVNVATGKGTSPDPDKPDVPVDPGEDPEPTEDKKGHLTIEKVTTSTAKAEDGKYALGEEITYEITVTNDGNLTITDITVTDELTNDKWAIDSLAPGESKEFTAKYVVTEADILAGQVVNVATGKGTSPDPDKPDVPVVPGEDPEPTEDKKGHLTIEKVTTSTAKAEDGKYALGEEITYEITVTNDGNLTITDITVTDELTNDKWAIDSLAPGESKEFTAKYVVTEADILAGQVVNVATGKGTSPDPDKPDVPVVPGEDPEPTEDKKGHLTIEKVTTSTAKAEDGKYALGEEITYKITVTNDGNLTITDITVTDELTGDEWPIKSLAPNASEAFETSYTVTEADVLAGEVVNVATGKGTSPDPDKPDVPVVPGEDPEPTEDKKGHLTIEKVTTSTAKAEDGKYALGEEITYKITVTNDGNLTIKDITVTDELTNDKWTIASLAPGASKEFTTEYVVTEADVLKGEVLNVATAKGTSPDPEKPDVPVVPGEDPEPTEEKNGHITIEKETTSKPANGSKYVFGETITYKITVTNDGNLTVKDITVTDELTGDEWTIPTLAPGESKEFTAKYVVTAADVLKGEVVNVATGKGTSPDPDKPDVPVVPGEDPEPVDEAFGPVTIASATRSWTYDGATHTEEVYTVTYDGTTVNADATGKVFTLPTGDKLTITATADGVKDYGAGYSRNNTFTYTLAHADHYTNVSVTYGTLRINKRQVTLTSASATKLYDGAALRRTNVTVTGDGWVKGEGATYDAFPSITDVGTVANTFTYQLNAGTKADNYEITVVNGRLRVFVEEIPDEEVPLAFPGYLGNQTGECFE